MKLFKSHKSQLARLVELEINNNETHGSDLNALAAALRETKAIVDAALIDVTKTQAEESISKAKLTGLAALGGIARALSKR